MVVGQKRDALKNEKFYFRRYINAVPPEGVEDPDAFELMDVNTIINGQVCGRRPCISC